MKGLDQFFDVLAILKDPKLFEERAAQLAYMLSKNQSYVEAYTKLKGVDRFIEETKAKYYQSEEVVKQAEAMAETIVLAAKTEDASIRAKIEQASEELAALVKQQEAIKADTEAMKKQATLALEAASKELEAAEAQRKHYEVLVAEYTEKREQLLKALA